MTAPATNPARPPVVGVVVTYFPDADFAARLAAIARETSQVIVVDNSANDSARAAVRAACAPHGARLVENAENRGLGAALNQAVAMLEPGVDWIVAFDQDSTPEPGFTDALWRLAAAPGGRVAIVGANWRDEARPDKRAPQLRRHPVVPFCFERVTSTQDLRGITCVITSGSLFHVPTLRQLGGFNEELFLDLVDSELCLRTRAAGYDVAVAAGALMCHRRGAKRAVRCCGREWWPAFMPPSRLHYVFRNRILVARRHGWRFPHWVMFELVFAAKILTEILLFEDRKFRKFAACWIGTWHGLMGRAGQLP